MSSKKETSTAKLSGKDFFKSLRGDGVQVFMDSSHIEVRTENEDGEEAYFIVDLKQNQKKENVICFNVSTVDCIGDRIGLFGKDESRIHIMAKQSIVAFDNELAKRGSQVDGIFFCWLEPGCQGQNINFSQYMNAMNELEARVNRREITLRQAQEIAVSRTWEMETIAFPNEFTELQGIEVITSMMTWIQGMAYRKVEE